MRDDSSTGSEAHDEGALLAAYLAGDTDDVTTARIERRLASDDALAARLDALAATRARLQRLDEVTVPADVRARLRVRLDAERAGGGAEGRDVTTEVRRAPGWSVRATPVMATAAAIVLIAVLGAAAVLGQFSTGGTEESAGGEVSLEGPAGAEAEAAPDEAGDRAAGGGAGAMAAESAASEPARGGGADQQAAAEVAGDAEIAARAERLRADPPENLRARERRLREQAGLPMARLCVRELRATTVDLVDEDGRVALAVMIRGASPQIVLLDPRTCAAIRTIPAQP
jgi:hypothetical protein